MSADSAPPAPSTKFDFNEAIEIFKDVLKNRYAQFTGRARRKEYWNWFVIAFIANMIPLVNLALIIPNFAIAIRRCHDMGKSGWFVLISLIPFIGGLYLLYLFYSQDSQPGENRWGPNPKGL